MEWIWIAVAIVAVLIGLALFMRPKDPMLPTTLSSTPLDTDAQIEQSLRDGKKIQAIKLLRDATPGLSLEDAKRRIDHWHTHPEATLADDGDLPAEIMAEIDRLISDGKKIQAIKVLRDHTNWGLKEAKDYIDRLDPPRLNH